MKCSFTIMLFLFCLSMFGQQQFSVFFNSNKSGLSPVEKKRLEDWISRNKDSKIVAVNGYTDEDGSTGFNDTLAQKRVDFIFNSIQDKVKIRDDFKSRSFGERQQLSKIKAENRKVTIYFIEAKDLSREDEILGIIKTAPVETAAAPKPEIVYPETLVLDNPDGTKSEFKLDREFMKQIGGAKSGEKLRIDNLNFQINTFAIVPASRHKLYELLLVLQKNPGLKVQIQGHLCCMPTDRTDLSTQRAKAIYSFLIANNIDKSRLSYKGFGSTKAIYALPEKDESQRAANRRVEIEIVENP